MSSKVRISRALTSLQEERRVRLEQLRQTLFELRNEELRKAREFHRAKQGADTGVPGDEGDCARLQEEIELYARLANLSGGRLAAIEAALERFEEARYGTCEECGEEISLDRLRALPTTERCVDCAQARENAAAALAQREITFAGRRFGADELEADESEVDEENREPLFAEAGSAFRARSIGPTRRRFRGRSRRAG